MAEVIELRPSSRLIGDARGPDRALRVTWHPEHGLVVLSLWRGDRCVGTVRVDRADVPELVRTLVEGLVTAVPAVGAANPA